LTSSLSLHARYQRPAAWPTALNIFITLVEELVIDHHGVATKGTGGSSRIHTTTIACFVVGSITLTFPRKKESENACATPAELNSRA
jgi:hypothetical protein